MWKMIWQAAKAARAAEITKAFPKRTEDYDHIFAGCFYALSLCGLSLIAKNSYKDYFPSAKAKPCTTSESGIASIKLLEDSEKRRNDAIYSCLLNKCKEPCREETRACSILEHVTALNRGDTEIPKLDLRSKTSPKSKIVSEDQQRQKLVDFDYAKWVSIVSECLKFSHNQRAETAKLVKEFDTPDSKMYGLAIAYIEGRENGSIAEGEAVDFVLSRLTS